MQITIHEIKHFTLITELLTFTIYFAFLCKPIWGTLVYHDITVLLVLTSSGTASPPKYLEERCSPAFRLDYTTWDSCYFQIHNYSISAMRT